MILGSEAIVWQDGVPDADITVRTQSATSDEPIWLAYWDGEIWRDIEGFPRDVVAWANPPAGLPNATLLPPARPQQLIEGVKA